MYRGVFTMVLSMRVCKFINKYYYHQNMKNLIFKILAWKDITIFLNILFIILTILKISLLYSHNLYTNYTFLKIFLIYFHNFEYL